jgi:hypothetical protein
MIGFDGRLQWRQQELFKLRAKLPQCKKNMIRNELGVSPRNRRKDVAHPKFATRSFFVRRTRNEHAILAGQQFQFEFDQR